VPNSTTRTPATDMLYNNTNGRAHNNSTTCCTTNLPPRNARVQNLDMSKCWDVANFSPLVVLYNMSIAGVRVVEFGTYNTGTDTHGSFPHQEAPTPAVGRKLFLSINDRNRYPGTRFNIHYPGTRQIPGYPGGTQYPFGFLKIVKSAKVRCSWANLKTTLVDMLVFLSKNTTVTRIPVSIPVGHPVFEYPKVQPLSSITSVVGLRPEMKYAACRERTHTQRDRRTR